MISEGSKRETMDFMYSEHRLNEDSSATVSESHSPSVNKCAADSPLSPSTLRHHQQDGALLALSQFGVSIRLSGRRTAQSVQMKP